MVEERAAAVAFLALAVGQPADREQVRAGEQPQPVGEVEADAPVQLVGNAAQPRRRDPGVHGFLSRISVQSTNSTGTGAGISFRAQASANRRSTAARPRSP